MTTLAELISASLLIRNKFRAIYPREGEGEGEGRRFNEVLANKEFTCWAGRRSPRPDACSPVLRAPRVRSHWDRSSRFTCPVNRSFSRCNSCICTLSRVYPAASARHRQPVRPEDNVIRHPQRKRRGSHGRQLAPLQREPPAERAQRRKTPSPRRNRWVHIHPFS